MHKFLFNNPVLPHDSNDLITLNYWPVLLAIIDPWGNYMGLVY